MDRLLAIFDESKKDKVIRSALDSPSFDYDGEIHVDQEVGSATISPSGRDVALASKAGLHIIDLDSYNQPRHLPYSVQWKIVDVQWSPFSARDYWIVSTANQKALVWNLKMEDKNAVELTLHAHSRAITDINFSAHHPDILSTCAVDGYVHCWDLRRPRTPVMTFVDWNAGATQVKYNRQDSHILASSHDGFLRIWDDRKGAYPLRSIEAHESKIYGVDWNRYLPTHLVTCSLDRSIRFWDYSKPEDTAERIIRTDFPVWRARHTPFGYGLLAMPQNSPGNLHLYHRKLQEGEPTDSAAAPVAVFPGHGNSKVKEFLWRTRGDITEEGIDNREFQLVTWGEDKTLRLSCVEPETFARVGYVKGAPVLRNVRFTRKGAIYRTFRSVDRSNIDRDGASVVMPHPRDIPPKIVSAVLSSGVKKRANITQVRPSLSNHNSGVSRDIGMLAQQSYMFGEQRTVTTGGRGQIGWMSGIKLTKKPSNAHGETRSFHRRYSLINDEFEDDEEWDAPESLNDELVRVHNQYSKVTFEEVDMDKRYVLASMNGPWGEQKSNVFLKVYIDFPNEYPSEKPAHFNIGKTSSISQEQLDRLNVEVNQIAQSFVERKQGCLETAFCYLIGDLDLEESILWFDRVHAEDVDDLSDESSSEGEDDEIAPGASAMMSQELDPAAAGVEFLGPTQNAPPPPRLCGASFAPNGSLVCFFPPKTDKTKSLLGTLNEGRDRAKGEPTFESFGRLNTNVSPEPRTKLRSLDRTFDYDSSDESDSSSSSDSDSAQYRGAPFPFRRAVNRNFRYMRALSTNHSQRSGSATGTGTGTGTGIGTSASRNRPVKSMATVSIHDVRNLLPAKQELAAEYSIFGDGQEVCQHNATVAQKYGYQELADVWQYASTLLHSNIPLEIIDRSLRREPVLVIAKSVSKKHRRSSESDSGVDLSADRSPDNRGLSARVKWGYHPLARQLIADLFTHFAQLADTQMLGMLSCVFSEPASTDPTPLVDGQLQLARTPLAMKTPAFSLDYFPSDEVVWTSTDKTELNLPMLKTSLTPIMPYGSPDLHPSWSGNTGPNSYSTGATPPLQLSKSGADKPRATQSLSTSPDDARLYRRAQTFAASFSRPFGMASSSSPPGRKKTSPAESVVNSIAPGVTWGHTTILGSVKEHLSGTKSPYTEEEPIRAPIIQEPAVTGIKVTMQNQNAFDDEGCMSTSLLDVSQAHLHRSYRAAYASMLYSWGHPLASLEILKFNGLPNYFAKAETVLMKDQATSIRSNNSGNTIIQEPAPLPIFLGKQEHEMNIIQENGLDVAGYCLKHDIRLEPLAGNEEGGGAIGRCERCKSVQRQLQCVVCGEPISSRYTACLSCGCVAHPRCQADYHASGEEECAGGCDCVCTEAADRGVVEGWGVMMGTLEMMRLQDGEESATRTDEDWSENDDWDVPERHLHSSDTYPQSPIASTYAAAAAGAISANTTPTTARVGSSTTAGNSSGGAVGLSPGLGKGYQTLGKRLEAVKSSEWSTKLRKKANSIRTDMSKQ